MLDCSAQVVLEIAMDASEEDRTPHLAIIYDELLRMEVENRCGQLGDAYAVESAMTATVDAVLRRAKR